MTETYVKGSELCGRGARKQWEYIFTLTVGRCREILSEQRALGSLDAPSRVNPSLTRAQAIGILEAALKDRAPEHPVRVLTCKNIMREAKLAPGRVGERWTES